MIRCRPLLILLFAFGNSLLSHAQKTWQVAHFTTDNGLPSNGIKGLQWDEETGFLWIGTEAGVTRYNGADFVTFSRINLPEMFSGRMLFVMKNLDGKIYTADETGNIFFVLHNKLQYLGKAAVDTRSSSFKLIGLSASAALFRQSSEHPPGQFGFNFFTETLVPFDRDHIFLHHKDSAYNIKPGLYEYRAGDTIPAFINTIAPGAELFFLKEQLFLFDHGFYFLEAGGIRTPTPIKFEDSEEPDLNNARIFWQSGMSKPILLTGSRAWLLDFKERRLQARLICSQVPRQTMIAYMLYEEKRSLLFLGTNSKGIYMIREDQVRPVRSKDTQADNVTATYSQLPLSGSSILVSQGDVFGAPPPRGPLPIPGVFNNFIFHGPDSLLWYSHGDTIFAYSALTRRTTTMPAGKGSITNGFGAVGNEVYFCNAIGIGRFRNAKVEYLYAWPQRDVNSNVPFAIEEIQPGILAIACCNGLFSFDTRTARLDTLLRQPGICVRALWKYKDYLFIGTYGKGIWLWKNGTIRPIPIDKNKYLEYAHCFIPDKLGYCWISSNKGLFRARPNDMIDAWENHLPEIYYHYFGRNDGMETTELNGGCTPCAVHLNDTTISFPSMDGLIWVDPSKPLSQLPEGDIYIDAFFADGHLINASSLMQPLLPPHTRNLEFHLGFPAWVNTENIYIDYKLEPWSGDWESLDIEHNPNLRFSNLPPGVYTLNLRKLDGFGEHNVSISKIEFRIEAPWYQQPWAWLLALCCLTAGVAGIVRLRTRQFKIRQDRLERQIAEKTRELKRKNEELEKTDSIKTRLISIISHDIVTPLKFLHLAGKSLIEKKAELPEELQRETITEIMNTSRELELLSTNILNWIKYRNEDRRLAKETFNVHALVNQIFGIFNSMAKQKNIRLINQVPNETSIYQFIEPVKIALYNLILNGINFSSEGGLILVSSSFNTIGISLVIRDTGVGMTQEQINNIMADHFIISSANVDRRKGNGLGYLIIKDLLKISRGSLSIESEKGYGTQVTVTLPSQ